MPVHHQSQRPNRPDPPRRGIGPPTNRRWPWGNQRYCLNPKPEANGPFSKLPAHQPEKALHGDLVEQQLMHDRPIAKRQRFLDQRLDRWGKCGVDFCADFNGLLRKVRGGTPHQRYSSVSQTEMPSACSLRRCALITFCPRPRRLHFSSCREVRAASRHTPPARP